MSFDVLKEVHIECCESMYALSINYLKNHDSVDLNLLLKELDELEMAIRICTRESELVILEQKLNKVVDRIEVIINE